MKKYIVAIVLCLIPLLTSAQEIGTPVDFLAGNWVRKVKSVTPNQAEELWKGQSAYVEFKGMLNGKGLHQISYEGLGEAEVHLFYDEPSKKMYGMTIDANGYVWQSEMVLNGNTLEITGTAIIDSSVKEIVQLTKVDAAEMSFVYTMFKNDKKTVTAEGTFFYETITFSVIKNLSRIIFP